MWCMVTMRVVSWLYYVVTSAVAHGRWDGPTGTTEESSWTVCLIAFFCKDCRLECWRSEKLKESQYCLTAHLTFHSYQDSLDGRMYIARRLWRWMIVKSTSFIVHRTYECRMSCVKHLSNDYAQRKSRHSIWSQTCPTALKIWHNLVQNVFALQLEGEDWQPNIPWIPGLYPHHHVAINEIHNLNCAYRVSHLKLIDIDIPLASVTNAIVTTSVPVRSMKTRCWGLWFFSTYFRCYISVSTLHRLLKTLIDSSVASVNKREDPDKILPETDNSCPKCHWAVGRRFASSRRQWSHPDNREYGRPFPLGEYEMKSRVRVTWMKTNVVNYLLLSIFFLVSFSLVHTSLACVITHVLNGKLRINVSAIILGTRRFKPFPMTIT